MSRSSSSAIKLREVDEDYRQAEAEVPTQQEADCPTSSDCLPPPDNLSSEAKLEWIDSAPQFHEAGILHGFVRSLFENFCSAVGAAREARAMVLVDGRVINGKLHPCVNDELNQIKQSCVSGEQLNRILSAEKDREIKLRELALAEAQAKGQNTGPWSGEKSKLLA